MDQGASPHSGGAEERIYALLAVAEEQQTAVRAGVEGMALERAAMATARVALLQQADQLKALTDKLMGAVGTAIPLMAQTAGQASAAALGKILETSGSAAAAAASKGVQPELAKFTAAAGAAAAVQIQLGAAVKDFQRKWARVAAFAIAGMVVSAGLVAYGAVWWQLRELGELKVQRDQLKTEVTALQEQADQAKRNGGRKPAR